MFRYPVLLSVAAAMACVPASRAGEEKWIKASSEHFTILTPAGESAARKWAGELEEFRRGLQNVVPVAEARVRPVTVVLFKDDRAMEPYEPLEKGRPARLGGLFVRANDVNTIMLSLAHDADETRHVVLHEAVHWHLSATDGVMPLWLGEGLAELYATFELTDAKHYAFGVLMPEYVEQLRSGKLLPLAQLMSIGRDSLLYTEGTRTSIFYAESWAFVHFLFYGAKSPGRESVSRYLAELQKGRTGEDAFAAAFGGNYADLQRRLADYISDGTYIKYTYRRGSEACRPVVVTGATRAEIELAKGSLLYGSRTPEDAEPHLRIVTALEPNDARAWELLGHIAIGRHDMSAAYSALSRAAADGSKSYLVYHNLAVSRLPAPVAGGMPLEDLDPTAMDAAAADFRRALELAPSHVPSYQGLAGLIYGMQTFRPEDVHLMMRGLILAPRDPMIEIGLASCELRSARTTEGVARLERLVAREEVCPTPAGRFARQLLDGETLKAEGREIHRLARENRFREVIAIADRALNRGLDPLNRAQMLTIKRQMQECQIIVDAVEVANNGDLSTAKDLLHGVCVSTTDRPTLMEAERLLREIAKRESHARR